jgi:TonB family protein
MKSLGAPFVVSLALHGLLLAGLAFWATWGSDLPLAGSGGGSGVTIEIVGGEGPRGEGGKEAAGHQIATAPRPPEKKSDAPRLAAKPPAPQKAKMGSQHGDEIPVGVPGPTGPGQGPGAPGPGSGENGSNAILAEIHSRIERAKRYPLMARKMNMEGVSYVRFAIGADGQPEGLALKSTSGYPVLDEAALETIRRAAPFPIYEEALVIGIRFHIDQGR